MSHAEQPLFDTSFDPLILRPLAGRIGARVEDLALRSTLDEPVIEALHAALVRYKVLFLRGQQQLDDAEHQALGERFGRTVAHPTVPAPAGTRIFELDASHGGGRADSWHTDVTFVDAFPKLSILRAVTVPAFGGDTVWANTAAAYAHLPDDLKTLADRLWAVHSNDYDYGAERTQVDARRLAHHREVFVADRYETEHPVVHVHPVSGERALLLGHFVRRLQGLTGTESARLFELLQARVIRLENTVRWRWRQGDVAIWDNRATQHYAINDYGDQPRVVRRVTVQGETAVAIDGRRSRVLSRPQAREPDALAA